MIPKFLKIVLIVFILLLATSAYLFWSYRDSLASLLITKGIELSGGSVNALEAPTITQKKQPLAASMQLGKIWETVKSMPQPMSLVYGIP